MNDHDQAQVTVVRDLVRGILGDDVVGMYLYGSAVDGGLKPTSDIDIFAVSRKRLTSAQKRALIDGLLPISGSHATAGPARSIELTTVAHPDVRPWQYPPTLDFQYGDWLRSELEHGDPPAPRPNPDLAVLVTIVLRSGRPLDGPPTAEVFDPVPRADLDRALADVIDGLLIDLDTDTRNVILTLARIWVTAATGEVLPKDEAADWVLARLPAEHRAVIQHAKAIYLGSEPERWDGLESKVRPHATHVLDEIHRIIPR